MSNTNQEYKTFFVTAKVEVVYEVFTTSLEEARERFEEALDDEGERKDIFEDASSMVDIISVETADEHLGESM